MRPENLLPGRTCVTYALAKRAKRGVDAWSVRFNHCDVSGGGRNLLAQHALWLDWCFSLQAECLPVCEHGMTLSRKQQVQATVLVKRYAGAPACGTGCQC